MKNQEIDQHKKIVLIVLLKLTIIAGIIFSFLNFQKNQYPLATLELVSVILSLWLYYYVQKTNNNRKIIRFSLIYTTVFFSEMMFAFSIDGASLTLFVWVYTIPMISYLLLGLRFGFIFTAVFYSLAAILLFNNYSRNEIEFGYVAIVNIGFSALVFWSLSHTYEHANFRIKDKLERMAIFDQLTGLYNRTMLDALFTKSINQAKKENSSIGFLSLDLDLFKKINDQYGHITGDKVLNKFSKLIFDNIPKDAYAF